MGAPAEGSARLEPPRRGGAGVVRQRLVERLRGRFRLPVTVVVAPAGYGKTTALAQAFDDNRAAPRGVDRWLTCRPGDGAASALGAALVRAVSASDLARPGPSAPAVSDPIGDVDPGEAVAAVVEAMWHASPDEVALVLDDVHEVPPGSPGAELLARLLDALPANGHVVLCGRPPLPVPVSRLDVGGRLLRVAAAELLLIEPEVEAFAALKGVPAARVAECGGWPALAELVARAVPGVDAAYVWEEVLAGLAPAVRRAMALLAHVGAGVGVDDEALAAAVVGHDGDRAPLADPPLADPPLADPPLADPPLADPPLADLRLADLPLVDRTAGGGYVVHALWRPYLARHVSPADVAAARRRAGRHLAARGQPDAAVRLLTAAGAWDDVSEVAVSALGAARAPVPADVAAGWLERLPAALRTGPTGGLLQAVTAAADDPAGAMVGLEAAAARFRADGRVAGELACLVQLAQLAWWREEPERLMPIAVRLLQLEAAGDPRAVPLACLARALVADVANDCAAVLAELDRIPEASFGPTWQSLVDWLRSTSLSHLGRPAEALVAAERAAARAGPLHGPLIETARLQARWFLGHVDEVLEELPAVVERTAAGGLRAYSALVAATCCAALALAGRPGEAAPYLERARRAAPSSSSDTPLVAVNLTVAEAALRVATGDERAAHHLLADYVERAPLLGTGHAPAPQQRALALWYVLVPATRPVWERAPLGPAFAEALALAQAVVAVRATGRAPAARRTAEAAVVRAHLPLPWATELALGEIADNRTEGWTLLESLWPAAQPEVRRQLGSSPATPAAAVADAGDSGDSGDSGGGTGPGSSPVPASGLLRRPARVALSRLPVPPAGRFDLRLLGPVELRRDGVLVDDPDWRRERVRALLAHLVLHRPASREGAGLALWPDLDADGQSRNLRVTLNYLLRLLEPSRGDRDASFLVRPHGGGLALHRGEWFTADVWRFDDLWREATDADRRASPSVALDAMRRAVALWRGEPSELGAEPWALPEVEERRIRLVALATRAGELLTARGEPDEARLMAEVAIAADPWSDRAHHVAVAASSATGDHRAARRALHRYRAALVDLGLPAPDADTQLADLRHRHRIPAKLSGLAAGPARVSGPAEGT